MLAMLYRCRMLLAGAPIPAKMPEWAIGTKIGCLSFILAMFAESHRLLP